ncbi:MAG TPA: ABC transporter permease [Chloroflexota bacterium]|jgi:peptide/nickel transport system permease protein
MGNFLIRRLWQTGLLLVAVTVLVFLLVLLSGDPVRAFVPIDASPADVENIRHQYGLDLPMWQQYVLFVQHAAAGDLGQSFKFREPAIGLVLERLPLTAALAFASLLVTIIVAVPLGMLAATHRGSVWDQAATLVSMLSVSVPSFWLGILMILLFAGELRWVPPSGSAQLSSLILPTLTLSAQPIGLLTRLVRTSMIEETRRGYLTTARAKGIAEPLVMFHHALRNALIPIVTVLGLQLGALLGGSVIVETVFAWPGVGWLLIQAISAHDLPLLRANVLVIALLFVTINTLTDILYAYLNPRIRFT